MRQRGRSAGELLTAFTELDPASVASDALGVTSRVGDFPDGGLGDGDRIRWDAAPRHGWRRPGLGWSPVDAPARLPVFRATAAQVGGLFPLLAAGGVPAVGARLGCDASSGSAFYVHPTEWVLRQLVTNPNMMIFGEPGRGKSSTVVALVLRLMLYGVRTLISGDRKGEYTPVLRALGAEPIALGAGSPRRLNALDLGPLRVRWSTWSHDRRLRELKVVLARWNRLLLALAQAQGYAPTVTDEYVLHLVLRRLIGADDTTSGLRPVTIPRSPGSSPTRTTPCGPRPGSRPGGRSSTPCARSPTPCPTWSPDRWPGCSTRRRTSTSTGTRRSSRWTCRGWNHSATPRSTSP